MPVFDKFNTSFQTSSAATVHKLHERLLKKVLSFFYSHKSDTGDLTRLKYSEESNHLLEEDLFITRVLIIHQEENKVKLFIIQILLRNS